MFLINLDQATLYFCIQVDYSHGHCCDHVVDVEPGLFHLAVVSVLELIHDIDSDVFF